jgi:hypothetical protein
MRLILFQSTYELLRMIEKINNNLFLENLFRLHIFIQLKFNFMKLKKDFIKYIIKFT